MKFSIFAVDGAARVESGASWIGRDKVILLDGRKTDGMDVTTVVLMDWMLETMAR